MSTYQLYEFNGVPLPLYNPEADLSTGNVGSTLRASIGGVFDVYGLRQRLPTTATINAKGIYAQSDGDVLLVDHSGNYIVTEAAAYIRAATNQQWLRWQVDAIKAQIGKKGDLLRRRWDDTTVIQKRLVRLLAVNEKGSSKQRAAYADLELVFETGEASWRDSVQSTASVYLPGGGTGLILATNDGNIPLEDAVITVAAGQPITSVTIACADIGVSITWTGSLPASENLVIDCGAKSVNKTSGVAYSGFSLGGGHTARSWLPLAYGINQLNVTANDTCIVTVTHYNRWG